MTHWKSTENLLERVGALEIAYAKLLVGRDTCRAERAELIEALRQTANLLYEAARAGWPIANIYSEGADAARALLEKLEGRPE